MYLWSGFWKFRRRRLGPENAAIPSDSTRAATTPFSSEESGLWRVKSVPLERPLSLPALGQNSSEETRRRHRRNDTRTKSITLRCVNVGDSLSKSD